MSTMPTPAMVRHDIFKLERTLLHLEQTDGKASESYRRALRELGRLWCILRLCHASSEFLREVTA